MVSFIACFIPGCAGPCLRQQALFDAQLPGAQLHDDGADGFEHGEQPRVEILLDEALIEYVSSTGTRRHQWEKIGEIQETEDFVILVNGKLPLLSLPKACFSSEALTFMKEKCRAGRHC